jgi:hypothetical protein
MAKFTLAETPDRTQLVVSSVDGGSEISRFPVEQVLARFQGDMRQLLSAFEYSDRLGLPMAVSGSAEDFGEQMHQNVLYDRGRTSDDDRFDD